MENAKKVIFMEESKRKKTDLKLISRSQEKEAGLH